MGNIYKVRCPRCLCFILLTGDLIIPETLPEPESMCESDPICTCHTGTGLMPRFEVFVVSEKEGRTVIYMLERCPGCLHSLRICDCGTSDSPSVTKKVFCSNSKKEIKTELNEK